MSRRPRPIQQQIAEGDPRKIGKRKLQERLEREPKATEGLPPCAKHLGKRARVVWNFWTAELIRMDLDRRPDAAMLEGLCLHYARAVEADLIVQREGIMIEERIHRGKEIVLRRRYHPAVAIANAAWRQVRAFCVEFGFSPAARTRLAIERDSHADAQAELERILSRPRDPRERIV